MITRQRNLVLNEIAVELAATQEYDQAITLLNKVIEEEVRLMRISNRGVDGRVHLFERGGAEKLSNCTDARLSERSFPFPPFMTMGCVCIHVQMEMLAFEQEAAGAKGSKGRHVASDIDFRFLVNRGDCHRALDNIDLALTDYHRAHDVRPTDWEVRGFGSIVARCLIIPCPACEGPCVWVGHH